MLSKIKELKNKYQYKECREIIFKKKNYQSSPKLLLALAECYYKDNELYYKYAFKKALEILENKNFEGEDEKERLNLMGAVYKRYWEKDKKIEYLLKAIKSYKKAWNNFKNIDKGYGGVNAANLIDELGYLLDNEDYKKQADKIRNEIVKLLQNNNKTKWDYHTLITAYFGLGEFDKIKNLINKIINDDEWEIYTTYEACYKLNKLKKFNAKEILKIFFEEVFEIKKIGLALSGGGFRASLFHLGSLAALAEVDKLKDISVISTVSGGSIIGVLYYLKVKKLLESKKDEDITQKDYLKVIEELIDEFLEIITNKNIRNEAFFNFNIFSSRTQKVAKLYYKYFYAKYNVIYLKDLLIIPKGEKNFKPRFQNFKRKNKVPILVINATNLNNGHNFQFHATKMGEVKSEFDKNFRVSFLRKGCEVFDNFLVSEAVAASSAVPGVFPALKIKLQNMELSLVDGGVYENIGLNALFNENVDEVIVSDGGYEMENLQKLSISYSIKMLRLFPYLNRTISVLMDVNKDLIYEKITQNKILNILADERNEFEVDCKKMKFSDEENFRGFFSKIRTDLDKFNKSEANAIIYLGYIKMKKQLKNEKFYEYDFNFKEIEILWMSNELGKIIKDASKRKILR